MLILRCLVVWSLEMLLVSAALGIILYAWFGPPPVSYDVLRDIVGYAAMTAVFMFGSGYLLTSAISSVTLRGCRFWLYPVVAAALFIVHLQFFASGWTTSERLPIQALGACIVIVCTLAGGLLLHRPERSGG